MEIPNKTPRRAGLNRSDGFVGSAGSRGSNVEISKNTSGQDFTIAPKSGKKSGKTLYNNIRCLQYIQFIQK